MARHKLGLDFLARADFDRAVKWRRAHPNLPAPYPTELDAFQAEAQALLDGPGSSCPPTCSPRTASMRAPRGKKRPGSRSMDHSEGHARRLMDLFPLPPCRCGADYFRKRGAAGWNPASSRASKARADGPFAALKIVPLPLLSFATRWLRGVSLGGFAVSAMVFCF